MALVAARVREHHPDATEIALGLDYDPDGQTFIGSASLRRGDGRVIDADGDDLDELRYDIGTVDLDGWEYRFLDNPQGRTRASVESIGIRDDHADEIRVDVALLTRVAVVRRGR